ncbi:MAG: SDR family NAD(P)-dependent oxidoreductase, partial [Pseudolysinimonas sp.]
MMALVPDFPDGYGVVVIGGGSGIGAATSRLIAGRGARVFVMDVEASTAEATASSIRSAGGDANSSAADVTSVVSLSVAFQAAVSWLGQVHAVINTAGMQGQQDAPSHQVDIEGFERTVSVNMTAALRIAHVVIPHMLENGYGRIAHVASIAGKEGNPNMVAYSASKAGLIGIVKTQGKEYAQQGITVNA